MYYDLNILEGRGIKYLRQQVLTQIACWVILIPSTIVQFLNS